MSIKLGKRKERGDVLLEDVPHGSTLFVSNLPYTATSVDLQTLFSDIAPVRSAFVVTEQGTGVSKGVGYVSFAIKEDAESTFEKISKEGITLVGRNLRVQWAEKRKDKGEKSERPAKESKPHPHPRSQVPRTPYDPLAIRTLVVSGLPSTIDSKVLWKKMRKYDGAEEVHWPIKLDDGNEDSNIAHVLFTTPSAAQDAVNKLHAHVFKGNLLSATLKKRLDVLSKPTTKTILPDKQKKQIPAAPSRASRLIVRNLPFNATDQDLRAVFLPYGPVHSIDIPTAEQSDELKKANEEVAGVAKSKQVRTKGFAFVWMLSKKDAERAIEGCNGMVMRAGMAEGLVSDKQKKKKQKRLEKKMQTAIGGVEGAEDDDVEEEQKIAERTIAVDWALSKEKWNEEKAKIEKSKVADEDIVMVGGAEGEASDYNSQDDTEDEAEGDDGLGMHDANDGNSDEESSMGEDEDNKNDDDDQETPVKPQLPPPETGTTLFIRNVPFTATEDELKTLLRPFGPLRYVRITIDPATERSRGTGFACFWSKEDADKVIEQSDLLRSETTGTQTTVVKKNPFTMPSILTPDPSSGLAQSLVLHGRTLDVIRAVTRDEAGKLKEAGDKARQKADKRNVYLLREGVILPNAPSAATLTPADIERRTSSFNARRALLKSNPSLYISKTRLSVRQIPVFVTERMLRRLALHAVRAFKSEVKAATRTELTEDELATVVEEQGNEPDDKIMPKVDEESKKKKWRYPVRNSGVKQAKIVRQAERIDTITLKGRSKGYGFVEMYKHSDALRVLRWANNNPSIGELLEEWWKDEVEMLLKQEKVKETKDDTRIKRLKEELEKDGTGKRGRGTLIVEFSIENVQVVKRRDALQKEKGKPNATAEDLSPKRPQDKPTSNLEEKPVKKRRTEKSSPAKGEEMKLKSGHSIGSIIGRKRKEKKSGKKGR